MSSFSLEEGVPWLVCPGDTLRILHREKAAVEVEEFFVTGKAPGFSPPKVTKRSCPRHIPTKHLLLPFFEFKKD